MAIIGGLLLLWLAVSVAVAFFALWLVRGGRLEDDEQATATAEHDDDEDARRAAVA